MNFPIELLLVGVALLFLLSVVASRISDRFGVPALLLFLVIGMLAGSDGPGGIYFDDPVLAQNIGIIALAVILFNGGIETSWNTVLNAMRGGIPLATFGVVITAGVTAVIVHLTLGFGWLESFLLGSIVSSTDAAAVFSILRARGMALRERVRALLELESGSNDPMAVFLTVITIRIITGPAMSPVGLAGFFLAQALVGLLFGFLFGKVALFLINRIRLGYEGMYPVLVFALILLAFGITTLAGGSGFLAVYVAGIIMAREDFLHKRSLLRFYDGMAWMMQITLFLTLGLLVFPSRLLPILQPGILIAAALVFLARPISVFLGLLGTKYKTNERVFAAWVGLRGAVPIVLGTYPFLADIPEADLIFHVVFFVVLVSVLLQGTTVPMAARLLRVEETEPPRPHYPIEMVPSDGLKGQMREIQIAKNSPFAGRSIVDLHLPTELLVILISRNEEFLIPNGGTELKENDRMLILSNETDYEKVLNQVNGTLPIKEPKKS